MRFQSIFVLILVKEKPEMTGEEQNRSSSNPGLVAAFGFENPLRGRELQLRELLATCPEGAGERATPTQGHHPVLTEWAVPLRYVYFHNRPIPVLKRRHDPRMVH